jgi:hypothetical protein
MHRSETDAYQIRTLFYSVFEKILRCQEGLFELFTSASTKYSPEWN